MNRCFAVAVASFAAIAIAPAANATTTITLQPFDGDSQIGFFGNDPATGGFTDRYEFTVPNGTVHSAIGSIGFHLTRTDLDFISVALNGEEFEIVADGFIDIRTLFDLPVTGGVQTLVVTGFAGKHAVYGGKILFTETLSPIPEPATWAMLIAGFGLAGGAIRVRARKVSYAA